jgi:bifunctional non-homologous end joining protein LigD
VLHSKRGNDISPPKWIKPQLTRLVDDAPAGGGWVHEVKYDVYRMHARIDGSKVTLLTRNGLDWSRRYRRTIEALGSLKVKSAYLDGELCALDGYGVPVFSRLQASMDEGKTDQLVFFAFDLLFLNGKSTAQLPLIHRKERLERVFKKEIHGLRYSEHVTSDGPSFRGHACKFGLEGVISKRADRPYAPGDRGIWVKSKCLHREQSVVVGWTDPEGSRSHIGALLLGYYTEDGCLHYAGRAGTGITEKELKRLAGLLAPLKVAKMPLAAQPPRDSRFGSPLKLSQVHWVRPELVVEVTYLTWTEDNLLRQVSYQGQREDKSARQVVRAVQNRERPSIDFN